jgi:glycosyltransferase involved in cell wall biosynthesis
MERAFAELIRRTHEQVEYVVVSRTLQRDLRPLVTWRRVRAPRRPFALKFVTFWVVGGARVRREPVDLVHTLGAIVDLPADLVTVQFCHAGYDSRRRSARDPRPWLRRSNTGLSRRLALAAERRCYRRAGVRCFAAVSAGIAEELRMHYPSVPTVVTPNGVDTRRFAPEPSARAGLRAETGVSDDACIALFVGGDWARKGLDIAIAGTAFARAADADVELWVVGPGDQPTYRATARSAGVGDAVRFFGERSDTERFYQASDVFVFPTAYEAHSLVAHEAAASGLPLVASSAHGIDELLQGQGAGILVERTPGSVGAAMWRLYHDADLRLRLGRQGRRRAQTCTWERSAAGVLETYRRLAAAARSAVDLHHPDRAVPPQVSQGR